MTLWCNLNTLGNFIQLLAVVVICGAWKVRLKFTVTFFFFFGKAMA